MSSNLAMSTIPEWYAGKKLFFTGGTGFVGKVIIEKLLRSCPDIDTIYMLVRTKKGVSPAQRFDEYRKEVAFTVLNRENPECFKKLKLIKGDVTEEFLGISAEDQEELVKNVEIVIHCAATVRFVLPLKESVEFNVLGTWRMLELAKEMKRLVSFVHVSTAYCQEIGIVLEERPYDVEHEPLNVIEMSKVLNEECMELLKPRLMRKNYCNTYTYTKALAEVLVSKYKNDIPIAIARPSVIIVAKKEPLPGFTEYLYGPNGIASGGAHGVIRAMYCIGHYPSCYVAVDHVSNATIAIAWDRGIKTNSKALPYYNIVESENSISWDDALSAGNNELYNTPFSRMMWLPFGSNHGNYFKYMLYAIFLHYIPALLIDFLCILFQRKPFLFKLYRKAQKGMLEYHHFTMYRWTFKNDNLKALYKSLTDADRETFDFDIWHMDWPSYIKTFAIGLRTFVAKDPPETIPKAKKLLKKLYILDRITRLFLIGMVLWFFWSYASTFLNIWNFGVDSTKHILTSFQTAT